MRQQGGKCAICGRPAPRHVDHDHATGFVRGILCFNCNGGLGQFSDDIRRLETRSPTCGSLA
ncbi:MAG TPA: endonuclease domain-containing protein [Acidimicrobiia bacterium]|nr:endonuclease domain-containing protein [Acidimicrobiia bacterium]